MTANRPSCTAQQQAAIETRTVSVALSAGAGCGKTFVLTQRFLSHLQPGPAAAQLAELVAITFTDKAAREMRDRIRAACRERLLNCPKAEIEHWLGVLYGLDTARIATIHSFCTSLLRGHAVEAGLDPRFTVGDAAQTDALLRRSARDTLHRLLEQQNGDAMTLVLHFGLERSRDVLADLIGQRFRCAPDVLTAVSRTECVEQWTRHWKENCIPRLLEDFHSSFLCEAVRNWLSGHQPKSKSIMAERCRTVRTLLALPLADVTDPAAWLDPLREAAKVQSGGGKSAWNDAEEHEEVQTLFKDLREQIDKCLKKIVFAAEDIPLAAELTEQTSRLAATAMADYEGLKRKLGWLDFDDLLLKAHGLLREQPEVARRLTNDIQLLMVDEFQDTDEVQADIVRRLAGPALKSGKLFLVGDPQQSIYRFRGAKPSVFSDLRAEIPAKGRLPLNENFRSVPDVLNFVNLLFQKSLGTDFQALTAAPAYQVSDSERKNLAPVIEFLWATKDVQPADPAQAGKQNADDLRNREADWIALRIAELLADAAPSVREKQQQGPPVLRRVRSGDIVVLFRTLSDVPAYEAALSRQGVDYYLVGGKTFYAQQEVFDLLNLCRWLDEPADEISLVGMLRSPLFNLTDDAVHALKLTGRTLTAALTQAPPDWLSADEQERIRFAGRVLSELRQLKNRVPPSELLKAAIERTGYDGALLLEHLGTRKVANLVKLVGQAAEFDDAALFTLKDYVRGLEQSVLEQTDEALAATLPEAGDVVRLMTIHQSKGLEFPVVFVADMNRKGNPRSAGALLHPQWGALLSLPEDFGQKPEHLGLRIHKLEEEPLEAAEITRLLYVATTRAADRLILSAGMTPDLTPGSPWMKLLASVFALNTGILKVDPYFGSMSGAGADPRAIPDIRVHRAPPNAVSRKEPTERLVPLSRLFETVDAAEPAPFPETADVFPPANVWHGMISVSQLEQLAPVRPAVRHAGEFEFEESVPGAAADVVGTVVHRVLQLLDFSDAKDWPDVFESCLQTVCVTSEERMAVGEQARPILERFINSTLARQLTAAAAVLRREVDFVLQWPPESASPRAMLTGQIDLLWQAPEGGWQVLDYKTGQFPMSVPESELLAPYALQLGIYALAAERALGEPLASIGLVVMRPKVRLLKFVWNDETRSDLCRRIEELL